MVSVDPPQCTARGSRAPGARQLLGGLRRARRRSDEVFELVAEPFFGARPVPERHRLIFYLGHLEAFDWNLLGRGLLGRGRHDPILDARLSFGIDPVGGELPRDAAEDWPALKGMLQYVRDVRLRLDRALQAELGAQLDERSQEMLGAAIEHRLMHAETLCYLLHDLPREAKRVRSGPTAAQRTLAPERLQRARLVEIPAGRVTLGRARDGGFGWDNEYGRSEVELPAFAIDRYPVTNGEFAAFVQDGGYAARELWDDEAWHWKEARGIRHPHFWFQRGGAWWYRGQFEDRPLPLGWPACVSQVEASAYARWREAELPSEEQWQRAAFGTPGGAEREHPWGSERPRAEHGNFGFQRLDPQAVDAHPRGASAFGIEDLIGNGWEWTRSRFQPLPGFEPQPYYPRYSAPFFDGRHFVLKGGSARTARRFVRRSFRNWFQPHYPHVYTKFRCVAR